MPRNKSKNIRTRIPRISSFIKDKIIIENKEKTQELVITDLENPIDNVFKENNNIVKKEKKNDNIRKNTASE